jgi:hypothetical protein
MAAAALCRSFLTPEDRRKQPHTADEGDEKRSHQGWTHLHVVAKILPAAGLLPDAASVKEGSLDAVSNDDRTGDRKDRLRETMTESLGVPSTPQAAGPWLCTPDEQREVSPGRQEAKTPPTDAVHDPES